MKLIDGKKIARTIEEELAQEAHLFKKRPPGLAFICVGNNPASQSYIKAKKKGCERVGIVSFDLEFETIEEGKLLEEIHKLNENPLVDGILIQLPLPAHLSTPRILEAISPLKDVDGFHPVNIGKLLLGDLSGFVPCTPLGIQVLLERSQIPLAGKHVVIVGRSNIVGKPLAALLMQKGNDATVTVAHSKTEHLSALCRSADILVAAMGQPHFIKFEMVREGAVVIDVGINRLNKLLVGDVDFEHVSKKASHITPVPGGVGPMTIAMLLSNTWRSYKVRLNS